MGKMKDKVEVNKKLIEFKDIMNDNNKNFIKDLLEDSKSLIDYKNETICIDRPDFDDESIKYIENEFKFKGMKFKLKLSRETYKNKIDDGFLIIICNIEYKSEENVESMLAAFDLKEKVHEWIYKYCDEIYWMNDDNNIRLSTYMYELIHKNENKFREVLSLYMLKKYGYTFMAKCIVESPNYESNNQKYKKKMGKKSEKIKLDFYNIGFKDLPKLLSMEINDVKLVGKQIPKEVSYDFGSKDSKYI